MGDDVELEIEPAEAGFFEWLAERERVAMARLAEPCPEYGLASRGPAPSDGEVAEALRRSRARVLAGLRRVAGLAASIAVAAAAHAGLLVLSARAEPGADAERLADARATLERIDAIAEEEAIEAEVPPTQSQADNKEGGTGAPFRPSAETLHCVATFDRHGQWCDVSPFDHVFYRRFLRFANRQTELLPEDAYAVSFGFDAPIDCALAPDAALGPRSYCAYRSTRERLEGIGEAKTSTLAEDLLGVDRSAALAPHVGVRPRWSTGGMAMARRFALAGDGLRLCTAAERFDIGATTEMWFLIGTDEHAHVQTTWHGPIPRPVSGCIRDVLGAVSFADIGEVHGRGFVDVRITSR